MLACLFACLTSQQHASVSQGRICSDNFTCNHTETEAADQTFYLTQSQYTDTGQTSPSADRITPGTWQGSHWSANFGVTGMTRPGKIPSKAGSEPRIFRSRGGRLNHKANEAVYNSRMWTITPIKRSLFLTQNNRHITITPIKRSLFLTQNKTYHRYTY